MSTFHGRIFIRRNLINCEQFSIEPSLTTVSAKSTCSGVAEFKVTHYQNASGFESRVSRVGIMFPGTMEHGTGHAQLRTWNRPTTCVLHQNTAYLLEHTSCLERRIGSIR